MPNDCLFCRIVAGEIPATVRYEDKNWLAFNDIHKHAPEHVLIIPKTHYNTLEEVEVSDHDIHSDLLITARKIAQQIGINDNYKLFMNVGERVQVVHHLHLHLLGGWPKETTTETIEEKARNLINS